VIGSALLSSFVTGFITLVVGCVFNFVTGIVTVFGCVGCAAGCVTVSAAGLVVVSSTTTSVTDSSSFVTGLAGSLGVTTGGFFTAALINDRFELPVAAVVVVNFVSDGLEIHAIKHVHMHKNCCIQALNNLSNKTLNS